MPTKADLQEALEKTASNLQVNLTQPSVRVVPPLREPVPLPLRTETQPAVQLPRSTMDLATLKSSSNWKVSRWRSVALSSFSFTPEVWPLGVFKS